MSDNPIQLVVAAFQNEQEAQAMLKELKQAQRLGLIKVENAAVIRRDSKNKLHIKETADMGGGKGAALGAVAGAAIGLLAGPVILVGAAGALVGGLAAKLRDSGFSNRRLQTIGDGLKPGTSAIVAVVEHKWVGKLEEMLEEEALDVMSEEISADIAAQLEAGHQVAYNALATTGALATSRVAAGENEAEISGVVVTEDGLVMTDAVITPEGAAGRRVTQTGDSALYEGAIASGDVSAYGAALVDEEGVVAGAIVSGSEAEEAESSEAEDVEDDTSETKEA